MLLRSRPETPARTAAVGALAARLTPEHLAVGRAGVGAVMVLRPRAVPQLLGVDSATATRMGWAMQMLGARELALGLGTLAALHAPDRRAARLWLAAGVLSDAVDALAMSRALLTGRVRKDTGAAALAVAAGAVAIGVGALDEPEVPRL